MITIEIAALLEAAPEQHSRHCAVTRSVIDAGRWPAAASGLRQAATQAQDWAAQAHQLADWCDAQAANEQTDPLASITPTCSNPLTQAGPTTIAALEAGLLVLAKGLGRDHTARVLQAISDAIAPTLTPSNLPAEATFVGHALDHDSLEQGEPA